MEDAREEGITHRGERQKIKRPGGHIPNPELRHGAAWYRPRVRTDIGSAFGEPELVLRNPRRRAEGWVRSKRLERSGIGAGGGRVQETLTAHREPGCRRRANTPLGLIQDDRPVLRR